MFRAKPERKLDKEFFTVSLMIVMHRPKADFDGHAETLRGLRAAVGEDRYFQLLTEHCQQHFRLWSDEGIDAAALERTLVNYCTSLDWLDTSMG